MEARADLETNMALVSRLQSLTCHHCLESEEAWGRDLGEKYRLYVKNWENYSH